MLTSKLIGKNIPEYPGLPVFFRNVSREFDRRNMVPVIAYSLGDSTVTNQYQHQTNKLIVFR